MLSGVKGTHGLSVLAALQEQELHVQGNGNTKSDQKQSEQNREYSVAIETRTKGSCEECDGRERNENRSEAHPSPGWAF